MCCGWGHLIWALSGKARFIFKVCFSAAFLMAVWYSAWLPWPWGARHLLPVLWITQFLSNYGFLFLPLLPWPSLCYMQFCVGIWSLETLESCVCLQAPERWGVWGLTFGSVFFPSDTLLLGFCHCFHFLLKHQRLGRVWGDVRRSSFMPDWLILIHMI